MKNEELVIKNLNLVYYLIHRYYPTFTNDDDLVQIGRLGLCKAAEKWDEKKCKFSTFASHCILNEIKKEFRERCSKPKTLSLDKAMFEEYTLEDVLVGDDDIPFIDLETFRESLDDEESSIFSMWISGFSNIEMAEVSKFDIQKVRKIVRSLKRKWEVFSNDD